MNKEQEENSGTYLTNGHDAMDPKRDEIMDGAAALEKRIAHAEARIVELEANVSALLTCLRVFGKVDGNELAKAYEHYSNEYHQQLLEPVATQLEHSG